LYLRTCSQHPAHERIIGNEADDLCRAVASIEHRAPDDGRQHAASVDNRNGRTGEVLGIPQTRFHRVDQPRANGVRERRAGHVEVQVVGRYPEGRTRPVCCPAARRT
jgi:hypothetical protein